MNRIIKGKGIQLSSVRLQLLLWFCLLVLATLVLFSAAVYFSRVSEIHESAGLRLKGARDFKAAEINAWIDRVHGDMKTIAENPVVKQSCRVVCTGVPDAGESFALDSIFNAYLNNFEQYAEFFIVSTATGRIVYSTIKEHVGLDSSGSPSYMEIMKGKELFIRDSLFSKNFSSPSVVFSVPLYIRHDKFATPAGVICGRVYLDRILPGFLTDRKITGGAVDTVIVNKDFLPLSNLRESAKASKISDEATIRSLRGGSGVMEMVDYRGRGVLAAFTYIPRVDWGLLITEEMGEVEKPAGRLLARMAAAIILLLAAASMLAVMVAGKLSRPVKSLIEVASKIQKGDLNVRNAVTGNDELSYLARSFNSMADTIVNELKFQKTCSDLIEIMVSTIDLNAFSSNLITKLMDVTGSCIGAFYVLTPDGRDFVHLTSVGLDSEAIETFHAEKLEGEFGRTLALRRIIKTEINTDNAKLKLRTVIGDVMPKELVTVPIIARNICVAIVSLASLQGYSDEVIRILNQIGPVMNTAFSNILAIEERSRLAREVEHKNRLLESKQDILQKQAAELQQQTEMVQRQNYTLQEQRKIVEESNKLKTEFLSNMSHELRTPLNSILSLSRVLLLNKSSNLLDEQKNYIEIIERNGDHLLALINDILDLSKIESGRIDLKPKRISLRSVISVIMENFEQLAEDKGITLKVEVPEKLRDVETDEARLYQILQNIIGNAVKFTERGGVTVTVKADGDQVHIAVADTGIGIAEKDLPHIFEEFRQIDGTLTRKYEGTGLGLAIAHKSAQLIKGSIGVMSTPGAGSTFVVTLPLSITAQFKKDARRNMAPQPAEDGPDKKRVLVVEDDMDTVITIRALLQSEYELLEAYDGAEGLEKAGQAAPDCVLLDIALPVMNGITVVERLKADPATRDIPVIAMTALYMDGDKERIMKAGCDDYIPKPFDIDGLKKTLQFWTRDRHEKNSGD